MISEKLKELEATKAKLAQLEAEAAADLKRELAALPEKYGFENANSFIKALKAAAGSKAGVRGTAKRRSRAIITEATRAQVKKLVEAEKTGAEIAKTLKISLPSVQNIKKSLGLVKPRK